MDYFMPMLFIRKHLLPNILNNVCLQLHFCIINYLNNACTKLFFNCELGQSLSYTNQYLMKTNCKVPRIKKIIELINGIDDE